MNTKSNKDDCIMKIVDLFLDRIKSNERDEELIKFEAELDETLRPVAARKQFILDLRKSLLKQMPNHVPIQINTQHKALRSSLLVTGWILGSVLVITTGIRGFLSILGVAGLIISWYKQNSRESFSPSNISQ